MIHLLAQLAALVRTTTLAFGGEDPVLGHPWHHIDITKQAATAERGFTPAARDTLAWHADQIDSYLYNPLWWAAGGINRLKVALATRPELAKLHFDDLFSGDHVRVMWRRYLSGTVAGLVWAHERKDVSAALNILGVSLHAVQDFYSHSNWVDAPERRATTWFALPAEERNKLNLWTGTYELAEHHGVKHHGKFAPECAVLKTTAVSSVMKIACAAYSPLTKLGICEHWRKCQEAQAGAPKTVLGVPLPANVVYLGPPGIALDSKWMSEIAVQQRGVTDASGAELFDAAKALAIETSKQWLDALDEIMKGIGPDAAAFWQAVKRGDGAKREQEYERFNRFPYTFLSAGQYPPAPTETGNEWYLRVRLKTSNDTNAGTNADITLEAGGKPAVPLDYMRGANPIIEYNDFEAGDDTVYVVGPFDSLPSNIVLRNRAPSALDVLASFGVSFVSFLNDAAVSIYDFLLSLIGGHADVIGVRKKVWSPQELAAVGTGGQAFDVYVDGGDEGKYRVHGTIRRTRDSSGAQPWENWAEYSVTLDRLECVKESVWDRGSSADEPFVLALLIPLATENLQQYGTKAFDDVDTGESRHIGHTFAPVRVQKDYGMLSLPICVMESDDEGKAKRDQLLREFADKFAGKTKPARQGFVDTLGGALASAWKLAEVEVFAFTRGKTVRAGTVLKTPVNVWLKGGERFEWGLDHGAVKKHTIEFFKDTVIDLSKFGDRVKKEGLVRPIVRPPIGGPTS